MRAKTAEACVLWAAGLWLAAAGCSTSSDSVEHEVAVEAGGRELGCDLGPGDLAPPPDQTAADVPPADLPDTGLPDVGDDPAAPPDVPDMQPAELAEGETSSGYDWAPETDDIGEDGDLPGELDGQTGPDGAPDVGADVPAEPDVCVPDCDGQQCGPNGCGGECGKCPAGHLCLMGGQCFCVPDCAGKQCGSDGCGGECGQCGDNEACEGGQCACIPGVEACGGGCCAPAAVCWQDLCCSPDCAGKTCGSDGCGGSCGECGDDEVCVDFECEPDYCQWGLAGWGCCVGTVLFLCPDDVLQKMDCAENAFPLDSCGWDGQAYSCGGIGAAEGGFPPLDCCQPDCVGKECGTDGCWLSCGSCGAGQVCVSGQCCTPDCEGKTCGSDGCGGSCGDAGGKCLGPQDLCVEGQCVCQPACGGKECGEDGCGGGCGPLAGACPGANDQCVAGNCVCQKTCQGKVCGSDGCGDVCGTCPAGDVCVAGICCTPQCAGKVCGEDGCGGVCGTCPAGDVCTAGSCCTPKCAGKACGPNGCGGVCGTCPAGDLCLADGTCLCMPKCTGKVCGDNGCGGSCGSCNGAQEQCLDGKCKCVPACTGKQCGPDGCGGVCGTCQATENCVNGKCKCAPQCTGKVCGSDGCGGECGACPAQHVCSIEGKCVCIPDCTGKVCGSDGCGGSCGSCQPGQVCVNGKCPPPGWVCDDGNNTPYDGCTNGQLTEFVVNKTAAGNQELPDVGTRADGSYIVAWQVPETGIFARLFNADSVPISDDIALATGKVGWTQRSLAVRPDGSFVTTWNDYSKNPTYPDLYVRSFSLEGVPQGAALLVNPLNFANGPTVVALKDGSIVVLYSMIGTVSGASGDLIANKYDSGMKLVLSGGIHTAGKYCGHLYFDAAPSADGGFVVSYKLHAQTGNWCAGGAGAVPGIQSMKFNAGCSAIGGPTWLEQPYDQITAAATFPDGRTAVAFACISEQQCYGYGGGFKGVVLKPDHSTAFSPLLIDACVQGEPNYTYNQYAPAVAVLTSGEVVAALGPRDWDGDNGGILAQRFTGAGAKVGGVQTVNTVIAGFQERPDAAAFQAGGYIVVWSSPGLDGSGTAIAASRFNNDGTRRYR